jgi:hypothetical protein
MECPFCSETIKDEAIVCKHCARDLRVARPMLLEIQDIVADLERLTRRLDRLNVRLERYRNPFRYFGSHIILYVLVPTLLLLAAHALVTIVLDISPLSLRLASVIIPILFGFATYPLNKVWFGGAFALGLATASLSIALMLTVTGLHDHVPIMPAEPVVWREVFEFGSSILLAFVCGNLLGIVIFQVLPGVLGQGGKPNAAAFTIARLLGQHVGDDQLRRRARLIQDLVRTVVPLVGVAATAMGSLYTGLKGILG